MNRGTEWKLMPLGSWQLFAVRVVDDGAVLMLLAGQKPRHLSSSWNEIEQQLATKKKCILESYGS
jgi:hypothetical protein